MINRTFGSLSYMCIWIGIVYISFHSDHNEQLQRLPSYPSRYSFPMTATIKCHTEFAVAVINGESTTLPDLHSQVSVDVPKGIKATLWQKVHTEFSRFLHIVPDDECFVGPVVEMHLKPFLKEKNGQHQYRIKIPHCLKTEEGRLSVKVRSGDLRKKIPFDELKHKHETSGQIPCFEVDEHNVIIYINHFTDHICSTCKEKCFSRILAFPFGSLRQLPNCRTQATLEVFLCCYLYKIEDFLSVSYTTSSSININSYILQMWQKMFVEHNICKRYI